MLEQLLMICLVVFAVLSVSTANFRRAVIYMAIFSLIMSLAFLYYKAPDVAIAEAVIGSAMATVLYLVALRKQDRLTVCVLGETCSLSGQQVSGIGVPASQDSGNGVPASQDSSIGLSEEAASLVEQLRVHFRRKRVNVQLVRSDEPLDSLLEKQFHDLLLCQADNRLTLYGRPADYRLDEIEQLLADSLSGQPEIRIIRCEQGGSCDA